MSGHDADGYRLAAGDDVQWEKDGGVYSGRYRCALVTHPEIAVVACRDNTLAHVPFAQLRQVEAR